MNEDIPKHIVVEQKVCPSAEGAVASLVLGILSLALPILHLIFAVLGINLVLGILAIVFGRKAKRAIQLNPNLRGRGMATAGLVLGIVSLALFIIGILFWIFLWGGLYLIGTYYEAFPKIP